MRWVADTGPVLHLAEAGAADLLPRLGPVVLPPAVDEELARLGCFRSGIPHGLQVLPLDQTSLKQAEDWYRAGLIDRGEAHAIALARQIRADVLLTDDAAARLFAASLGIQSRGSLGVVLWLSGQRLLAPSDATNYLDRLAATSLWLSPRILAEAHAALAGLSKK